jgi:hypothetical protein
MYKNNKKLILTMSVVLVAVMLCATLSGCGLFQTFNEADFITLMNELAIQSFVGDGLSVYIFLDHPEALGLDNQPAYLYVPNFNKSLYESNLRSAEDLLGVFKRVNYKKLSTSAKRDYDTIVDFFSRRKQYADFYYLDNRSYIGPNSGWNVMLPLYLDKLVFKTENDVFNWVSLAGQTERAFAEYARFEKDVLIPAGYARGAVTYSTIAEQCDSIAKVRDGEEHFLITIFKDKIAKVDFLSEEEKQNYILEATSKINEKLVPAYQNLAQEMRALSEANYPTKSLAEYSDGKAYYELLFRDNSSSSDSVETAYNNLKVAFNETMAEVRALQENLEEGVTLTPNMTMEALKGYYNILKEKYVEDFPALSDKTPDATFYEVPEAMGEFYNPASYFKSPLDSVYANETIYINSANAGGYLGFDIISHEGLPGHMLQHSYHKSTGANMLRSLLGYLGYAEGWASYAQYYSAKYFEGTEQEKLAYKIECLLDKAKTYLGTLIDIEINYYGKSKEELYADPVYSAVINDYMYQYFIDNPANYASYGYGNYKMEQLRYAFVGSDYDFHLYVLQAGPTSFEILAKYMQ